MTTFEPIATREYHRQDGEPVTVELGAPDRDGEDWGCRLRIEGLALEDVEVRIVGIDALQALLGALKVARATLDGRGLTFLGAPGIAWE